MPRVSLSLVDIEESSSLLMMLLRICNSIRVVFFFAIFTLIESKFYLRKNSS